MTHRLTAWLAAFLLTWAVVGGSAPASAVEHVEGEARLLQGRHRGHRRHRLPVPRGRRHRAVQPGRSTRGTGLDALRGSGIQVEGVQRWGLAGWSAASRTGPRPSRSCAIKGNDGYRERCIDTPPASGYWSYWHAGNNCTWSYSQWGVKNRDFVPGGFEGWSYSA